MLKNKFITGIFLVIVMTANLYCSSDEDKKNAESKIIIIYGDTRTNHEEHSELVDLIMKRKPYAVFHVGDLVDRGDDPKEWVIFSGIEDKLINYVQERYYPVIGNHEESAVLYFEKFKYLKGKRWYSVDIENLHFVMLDSNEEINQDALEKELLWLEDDLKNTSKEKKVIAVFHHPFFSSYTHGRDDKAPFILKTLDLIEKYGVKNVFNGHIHYYERSLYKGINFVITGAGGAPMVGVPLKIVAKKANPYSLIATKQYEYCVLTIGEEKIKTEVFNIKDEIIDSFDIE